jgi:hypothetical protein
MVGKYPIDILIEEIAVEVTGVVGVSHIVYYFAPFERHMTTLC